MRTILGIIGGLVAGVIAIILVGIVGVGMTFSVPAGTDPSNTRQVAEMLGTAPVATHLALMVAWFAGGLVGSLVGKLVARSGFAAWTVAGLIALYVLANVLFIPLPSWMQALWIAAPLLGGLIANHLVTGPAPAAAEPLDGDGDGGAAGNG